MTKAQRPKQARPHLKMAEDESYGAVCRGRWNFDPIRSRDPAAVWRELEAATGKTRGELRKFGWEVKKFRHSELPPRPNLARPTPTDYSPPTNLETYGLPFIIVGTALVILAAAWS
jgi:hypothetical protein